MSLIWKDMQASNKWRKGQQGLWAPSEGGCVILWESGLLDSQHTKSSASDLQCNVDQIPLIPASVSPSVKWETVEHYSYGYRFWSQTGFVQTLVSTFIYRISLAQLLTCVWLFATPWTAAHQASLPVHHKLPEFTQTHVLCVSDAIQPSHPLLSPSPPTFHLSQHQSFQMSQFFTSGGQSIRVSASALVLQD